MSKRLFPVIDAGEGAVEQPELPLCRDAAWDYEANAPLFQRGNPVAAEGKEGVLSWAWRALHVPRFRHEIYTWAYGSELDGLIGQPYTEELKRSEALRYVRETLEINPYITGVEDLGVEFKAGKLSIRCTLSTLYGKAEVNTIV